MFSLVSLANFYSNIQTCLCGGDGGKERCGGGKGEKERQNKFLPPPYTNPVYASGEEGVTGKLFNTVIARDFIFTSKFIKNFGSPNPRFEARYGKVITSVCFPIAFNHKSHPQ